MDILDSLNPLEKIQIAPNPFVQTTTISVSESWIGAMFHLYTLQGQPIQTPIQITEPTFRLVSKGLPTGVCLCMIEKKGKMLAKGKIIVAVE